MIISKIATNYYKIIQASLVMEKSPVKIPLYFILLFASLSFCLSCKQSDSIDIDQVDSIVFYAMPKGVDRSTNIVSLDELIREGKDTTITDRSFIMKFIRRVNHLRLDKKRHTIDIRSAAIAKHGTDDILIVVFGESFGTAILKDGGKDKMVYDEFLEMFVPSMSINGDYMKDDPGIFRLIDKQIYGTQSNDYWRGWYVPWSQ